jgi:hypothetical protein
MVNITRREIEEENPNIHINTRLCCLLLLNDASLIVLCCVDPNLPVFFFSFLMDLYNQRRDEECETLVVFDNGAQRAISRTHIHTIFYFSFSFFFSFFFGFSSSCVPGACINI